MVFLLCVFVEKCCGVAASTENFKMCWARVGHCQKRKRPPGLFCPAVTELMQPFQQKMCFFFFLSKFAYHLDRKTGEKFRKGQIEFKVIPFVKQEKKKKSDVNSKFRVATSFSSHISHEAMNDFDKTTVIKL